MAARSLMTDQNPERRSGECAIIGRANVGKSTLLNQLVGVRIAPTAAKPQTTRSNIRGILTEAGAQIIFVDTPGLHLKESHLLNAAMNRQARAALEQVEVIVFVVESGVWRDEEGHILSLLAAVNKPVMLCINKVDKLRDKEALLPMLAQLSQKFAFAALVPVSAVKGDDLAALKAEIRARLPYSEHFPFPEEQVSDRDERAIVAELIREQLMRSLEAELPYSVYVEIDGFDERGAHVSIAATIWVARDSQKGIVIGERGRMLKMVGSRARASIEEFLARRVYLKLWVKVKLDWQNDPRVVAKLTG
jgi:GTPase